MRDSRKSNANLGCDVVLSCVPEMARKNEKARGGRHKNPFVVRSLASPGARDENGKEPVS